MTSIPKFKLFRIISLLFSVIPFTGCNNDKSIQGKSQEEMVKNFANEFLEDERIQSVSIAVFDNGQESTYHFGIQGPLVKSPPTDSTLYELASVTKTFTGTMVAKAVVEGKVSLDEDVRKYLPHDYPNIQYRGDSITIRDILTHTSGFPNFPPSMESKQAFWEGLHEIQIDSRPGTEFNYSNTAPEITAYIVEEIYGKPYQELVDEFIFQPNEMTNTHFVLNEKDEALLIQGFNGSNEPQEHFKNNLWGAIAGIYSNTPDLIKYMKYHLNDSIPEVQESHKRFFSTQYDFDIGYYWNIIEVDDEKCYRHHGGIWGMQNWLMVFPESDLGIAVLSNASFEGSILSPGMDDRLEDLVINIKKGISSLKEEQQ